tara:strand:- start:13801 stop:14949 length:1149 start_codon:yes stop_codon:yes gene_type:complete
MKIFPYGRQSIDDADIKEVVRVLESDFITQGPEIEKFENSFSRFVDSRYAVTSNSATSSLHVACMSLDLSPGDSIWTSPNSFVASSNCGLYCGATVDFVDIELTTSNIDIAMLEKKLKLAKKNHSLPKILIPVHFAGNSCDMKSIGALSQEYNFSVIEDASHCVGAEYDSAKVGACKYSDACIFSFHPVKIMTTGEGGMMTTNSKKLYEKSIMLRSHGVTRNEGLMQDQPHGQWYFEQQLLGYNYRMTDIAAVLGSSQLRKVSKWVDRRRDIAKLYNQKITHRQVRTLDLDRFDGSAHHLYVIHLDNYESRNKLFSYLRDLNILVNVHYIPIHLHPYYRNLGFQEGMFPIAEQHYQTAISLPMYPSLTNEDVGYIADLINKF